MNTLSLMSPREIDSYAAFLKRLAGKLRGALPDYLRAAAARITEGEWQ